MTGRKDPSVSERFFLTEVLQLLWKAAGSVWMPNRESEVLCRRLGDNNGKGLLIS